MSYDLAPDQNIPTSRFAPAASPTASISRFALADDTTPLPICLLAATLCLAVGLIHIQDQGGFWGGESPLWLAIGYYAIETSAAITIPVLVRQKAAGWLLGAGVALVPFVGYVTSRTIGVPGDPGDVGNWGYTLGTVSLFVEGVLFALCVAGLWRALSQSRQTP